MGLEKTLKELLIKLNRPLLFFIPKTLIPKEELKAFDSNETEALFDKIVFYCNDGQIEEIISGSRYTQLLEKPSLLEFNMLRLIDEEAHLNATQFAVLLEKYILHLRFFVSISKWMDEHVNQHCKLDKNLKEYFKIQSVSFQNHRQEIETKFSVNIITDLTSRQILSFIKKDSSATLPNLLPKENKSKKITDLPTSKSKKVDKTEQQILITDQEARSFLLESVFDFKG
tara:strand:- start:6711 stop:7394 length:684 start_codon:yes stop_codon:yes gene_type:complete